MNNDSNSIKQWLRRESIQKPLGFVLLVLLFSLWGELLYFFVSTFIVESDIKSFSEFTTGYTKYVKTHGIKAFTKWHAGTLIIMVLMPVIALGGGAYFSFRHYFKNAIGWMWSLICLCGSCILITNGSIFGGFVLAGCYFYTVYRYMEFSGAKGAS